MKTLFKIFLIFFALLLLGVAAVALFFDANQLRGPIISQAEKNLHARLQVGEIDLSFYPYLGFSLGQVQLENQAGSPFQDPKILTLEKAHLGVSLTQLLKKNIIAELILDEPHIWYRTAANGVTNIDLILPEDKTQDESTTSLPGWINRFEIKSLEINNAFLTSVNQQTGKTSEIKALTLHVAPLSLTDAAKEIHFSLQAQDVGVGAFAASGILHRNEKLDAFQLEQGKLKLNDLSVALSGALDLSKKTPSFNMKAAAPNTSINSLLSLAPELQKNLGSDLNASGEAAFYLTASGNINAGTFKIDSDFTNAEIKLAEHFQKAKNKNMKLALTYQGPTAEIEQGTLKGDLHVAQFESLGVKVENFSSHIELKDQQAKLQNISMQAFDGNIQGSGVVNYAAKPIAWDFDLALQNINTNIFLTQLAGLADVLLATGDLQMHAKGTGITEKEIKESLSLTGKTSLNNGELKTLNFANAVFGGEKTKDLLRTFSLANKVGAKLELPAIPEFLTQGKSTFFNHLATPLKVKSGAIELPTLNFNTPYGPVHLGGVSSLDAKLDMKGNYTLNKESTERWLKNSAAKTLLVNSSGELVVPMQVDGSLLHPSVKPNFQPLAEQATSRANDIAKAKVKQEIKEEVQKIVPQEKKEEIKEKGKEILRKLF